MAMKQFEVKSETVKITATQTVRSTLVTPASGKRIRVISIQVVATANATVAQETYFGTGTDIDTDSTKVISRGIATRDNTATLLASTDIMIVWPEGFMPTGAVDEVVSIRATSAKNYNATIHYVALDEAFTWTPPS